MNWPITIKVKKLFPDAKLPVFSTDGAAGADLFAYIPGAPTAPYMRIVPGGRTVIGAGIAIEVPEGFEAQIRPRSGLALKKGISIVNTPGTIDSDYRGEIGAILINHGDQPFYVEHGARIAQIVIKPVPKVEFVEAWELTDTKRGDGGFGSTGVTS